MFSKRSCYGGGQSTTPGVADLVVAEPVGRYRALQQAHGGDVLPDVQVTGLSSLGNQTEAISSGGTLEVQGAAAESDGRHQGQPVPSEGT